MEAVPAVHPVSQQSLICDAVEKTNIREIKKHPRAFMKSYKKSSPNFGHKRYDDIHMYKHYIIENLAINSKPINFI